MNEITFIRYLKGNNIQSSADNGKIIINGGDVDLSSLTSMPDNVQFNNGGYVDLRSLTSMPDNVQFNNGGYVYLRSGKTVIKKPYIERFNMIVSNDDTITVYKKVSKDYKTQEETENETIWLPKTIVTIDKWNPTQQECGEGKFNGGAKPHWCDSFRHERGDKYIAIKVRISDLHEWTRSPSYPQKIGFREGSVLYECDRYGQKLTAEHLYPA